jgi:hypothetical protein
MKITAIDASMSLFRRSELARSVEISVAMNMTTAP